MKGGTGQIHVVFILLFHWHMNHRNLSYSSDHGVNMGTSSLAGSKQARKTK